MATLFEKVLQASPLATQADNTSKVKVIATTQGSDFVITLQSETPLVFSTLIEAQKVADNLNVILAPELTKLVSKYETEIKTILGI